MLTTKSWSKLTTRVHQLNIQHTHKHALTQTNTYTYMQFTMDFMESNNLERGELCFARYNLFEMKTEPNASLVISFLYRFFWKTFYHFFHKQRFLCAGEWGRDIKGKSRPGQFFPFESYKSPSI